MGYSPEVFGGSAYTSEEWVQLELLLHPSSGKGHDLGSLLYEGRATPWSFKGNQMALNLSSLRPYMDPSLNIMAVIADIRSCC